jgi:hypothetical protein
VWGVVHGSVNHLAALGRTTTEGRCSEDSPAFSEWKAGLLYGKRAGNQRGLRNRRRSSYTDCRVRSNVASLRAKAIVGARSSFE